jgi:hypothetical protein
MDLAIWTCVLETINVYESMASAPIPPKDGQLQEAVMSAIQNLLPESDLVKVLGVQRRM